MASYIFRRLIYTLLILLLVSVIAFMILHLIPGDPVIAMLGPEATQEQINNLRQELWLEKPLPVQYFHWLSNALQGDFGLSILYREEVMPLVFQRLIVTLHLGLLAFILSTILAIPAGVISALRRGGYLDSLITLFANLGVSVPVFWLGILMIYLFGLKLGLLPIFGYASPFEDFWLSIRKSIMPVSCLAVVPIASVARQTRSSMLEVIGQDYIRTAWAKGLGERVVVLEHALRNALIPIVTLQGMLVRIIVGGAALTETVFNIPGMGSLIVQGVFQRDYVLVQGCIIVIALAVALANLLVDISYGWLDPRIRYD